ncbi:hypothetical protein HMI54_014090, partial [Coelomomyces lativittatus]
LTKIDSLTLKDGIKSEEWKFKYLTSDEIPPLPFKDVPCSVTFLNRVVCDRSFEESIWMDILTRFQPIERPIKAAFSSIFLESLFKMETPILFPSFKEHEYKKFMINYLTYGRLNFNQKYPNRYVLIFNLLQFASGLKQTSYTYDSIHTGLKMLQYLLMVEIKIQEEEFNIKYFMPQYLNLESKFEGTWDLFSMRPLVIDEPMRDRN